MIVFLSGTVKNVDEGGVVLLVGGVGYLLHCPQGVAARLRVGVPAELHVRTVIKEDAHSMFGFEDEHAAQMFDLLRSVGGVGPKLALAMLSTLPLSELARALLDADTRALSGVSGVGKKTAERLALELASKVPAAWASGATASSAQAVTAHPVSNDATEALVQLGYRESQVRSVIALLFADDPEASADVLIRRALGRLR